ncbi:hypothetical protein [Isoptericola nanjingensis]|uniref:hypothetical protein n=1 Tax=Isoptericola nanjingensis TaxID=903413 RepID=UPI003D1CAE64
MTRHATEVQTDLPRLQISYATDWTPTLTLNSEPYELPTPTPGVNRRDPRDLGRLVALALDRAVHVLAINPEGGTYTTIAAPDPSTDDGGGVERPVASAEDQSAGTADNGTTELSEPEWRYPFGVVGTGFLPGEPVCVAVVVATREAHDDGTAELPLPAALLDHLPAAIVLLGRASGTLVVHDPADVAPATNVTASA